jgi:hypothetical protein
MDNFDMAVALIKEAQEEKRRYEAHHKAYMVVLDSPAPRDWNTFYHEYPKTPHKSIVNDNIKLVRRLLLKEYM